MGKDKEPKQGNKQQQKSKSAPANSTEVDPDEVRFTHSKIRPYFSGCGRKVMDTLQDIIDGRMDVEDLPLITVIVGTDGHIFSLNNRRLYVLKSLRSRGLLPNNKILVRTKPALPRELSRYTVDRCSLKATVMWEKLWDEQENEHENAEDPETAAEEKEKFQPPFASAS